MSARRWWPDEDARREWQSVTVFPEPLTAFAPVDVFPTRSLWGALPARILVIASIPNLFP